MSINQNIYPQPGAPNTSPTVHSSIPPSSKDIYFSTDSMPGTVLALGMHW